MAASPIEACLRCVVAPPPPTAPGARQRQQRLAPPLIAPHHPTTTPARWALPPGQEDGDGPGGSGPNPTNTNDDDDDESDGGGSGPSNGDDDDENAVRDDPALDPLARLALAALRIYRQGVSPLLQPACRYQPTCSRYAISSYRAYGGWKGTVLTTWRLARCAPWGKGGFDPPRWPPVGLEALFQYDAAAPVAVVLTAAGFVRLVHALLFE